MSIGMGQLVHMIRRNVPVVYILEDNGVYGLTKGQFSATADVGSALKHGAVNELPPIDPCTLAMELGCGFVARSFSGNPKQLNTILKAAFAHEGTGLHRRHQPLRHLQQPRRLHPVLQARSRTRKSPSTSWASCPYYELEDVEIPAGEAREVDLPRRLPGHLPGHPRGLRSHRPLRRHRSHPRSPDRRANSSPACSTSSPASPPLHDFMHLVDEPLATLPQARVKPGPEVLQGLHGGADVARIDGRPGSARLISPWGCSSAGRALHSHCRGRQFDPDQLHQTPREI